MHSNWGSFAQVLATHSRTIYRKAPRLLTTQRICTLAAIAALTLPLAAQQPHKVTQEEVDRITREAILIDTHNDVTSRTVSGYDIATPNKSGETDLPRMKGFLGAEFFAVYVGAEYVNGQPLRQPRAADDRHCPHRYHRRSS